MSASEKQKHLESNGLCAWQKSVRLLLGFTCSTLHESTQQFESTKRLSFFFVVFLTSCADTKTEARTDTATSSEAISNDEDSGPNEDDSAGPPPNIWNGPKLTFTKEDFADFAHPENQDSITPNVILTRGTQSGIFNIAVESSHTSQSPTGTEWAEGTTSDLESLTFEPLKAAANNQMKNVPGKSFVLHLIEEDVYIDVTFTNWTSGSNSGGGFGYERSTE